MPFAELLAIRIVSAVPERVDAEMTVRPELCTKPAVLHGGALMAFADSLGAYATSSIGAMAPAPRLSNRKPISSHPPRSVPRSSVSAQAIHRGKRAMVWQTRVTLKDGRLIGIVTQTQMVLEPRSK